MTQSDLWLKRQELEDKLKENKQLSQYDKGFLEGQLDLLKKLTN